LPQSATFSYTGTKDCIKDSAIKESPKEYISVIDIENGPPGDQQNSPPKKPKQISRPLPVAF
jgi:hypothetical protein